MFGLGADPFQGHQPTEWDAGGPMAGIQNQIAEVLNGDGTGSYFYFPTGQDSPLLQVPNPLYWDQYQQTQYRSPAAYPAPPVIPGMAQARVRLTAGELGLLLAALAVVAAVAGVVAGLVLMFIH
jgi:hypothetical protein